MVPAFFGSLKQEFTGYNSKKLLADMMAGLTVCAVALPLALAFGVSSGASAASGLVTAIIAVVVIAILGGASYQISGPTGAMSAVLHGRRPERCLSRPACHHGLRLRTRTAVTRTSDLRG